MKILVTEPDYFPEDLVKELERLGDVVLKKNKNNELINDAKYADVILARVETQISREVIDAAENLKLIGSMTTGLDHIDTDYAKKKGIEVVNFPGYATESTAQYVIALVLSLMRNVPWAFQNVKDGRWERYKFLGKELTGRTMGIVGFGRIGSTVGMHAKSLGMKVIFYDPYATESTSVAEAEQVGSVDEVLERSDVVTVHAMLSNDTKGMFDRESFSKMKNTAVLVNTSRGEIVNDSDLIDALQAGEISAAALDVFSEEPLPYPNKLTEYAKENENLLLTPHIAGSTEESIRSACNFMIEKVKEISSTPSNKTLAGQE